MRKLKIDSLRTKSIPDSKIVQFKQEKEINILVAEDNELNQKFIVSKDFAEKSNLKPFQLEDLGIVELKGKANGIELFALKI